MGCMHKLVDLYPLYMCTLATGELRSKGQDKDIRKV